MKAFFLAIGLSALAVMSLAQGFTKTEKQELANLAKIQKGRDIIKAALNKHPHDPALQQKFVDANDKLAYATMTADALTSHQKYSTALRLYRITLKVNPRDGEAAHWVQTIESIYRSMHRPIPQ